MIMMLKRIAFKSFKSVQSKRIQRSDLWLLWRFIYMTWSTNSFNLFFKTLSIFVRQIDLQGTLKVIDSQPVAPPPSANFDIYKRRMSYNDPTNEIQYSSLRRRDKKNTRKKKGQSLTYSYYEATSPEPEDTMYRKYSSLKRSGESRSSNRKQKGRSLTYSYVEVWYVCVWVILDENYWD